MGNEVGRDPTPGAGLVPRLLVVGVAAVVLARTGRRWTFAAAAAWGLSWIAVGRLTDSPESVVVGAAAVVAALAVLALAARARPVGA